MQYRNSQLRMRHACGFAYAEEYVHGRPGVPSPSLRAGDNVHRAVAEAARAIVRGELLNIYEIAFRCVTGGDLEYHDALRVLTSFQEQVGINFDIDPNAVFILEERLEMPIELPDGETVVFFGTPDLVESMGKRGARITDWKTHWQPESQEDFDADPQLERYALLVSHNYPKRERFELVKRFVRYKNNSRTKVVCASDFFRIREQLIADIMEERAQVRAGNFEATPGDWCALCSHHAKCPRIRRYREEGINDLVIPDDDTAQQLAGDAIALDAAADAIQRRLRRYLGGGHVSGYVSVAGGTYGYGPAEERAASPETIAETLRLHGVEPPLSIWKVDYDQLERLLKRLPPHIAKAVSGQIIRTETSRCQFRRNLKGAKQPKREEQLL